MFSRGRKRSKVILGWEDACKVKRSGTTLAFSKSSLLLISDTKKENKNKRKNSN